MKSLRLIEAAGQPDSGADQAPAFFVSWPSRAALVAEGDPRPSVPCGSRRRASEGENAPRLRGDWESTGSAPRREISASHRSCGAAGFRSRPGAGFFCVLAKPGRPGC
ncbi:hypothetical protein P8813_11890 [Bacillus velezensis]|uniref:hypothetical protein n=2 Tax=Bacillus subtilis group TaxID=653685 RepID=UPI002DB98CF4|nr:hypothetical protein [Bacillus velezensis]MEC0383799.1 hypothetical protein [Bacillus velezensis]